MAPNGQGFQTLLERTRQGCSEAACLLIKTYQSAIVRVVHRKLHSKLRSLFDPSDFVQEVWLRFFARWVHERVFKRPDQLLGFLVKAACSRVGETNRQRLEYEKYDVQRHRSLEEAASEVWGLIDSAPSVIEAAIAREEWDRLLQDQPARHRQVLRMLYEGYTHYEVARKLALNERTIRRVVHRASEQLGVPR